MKNKTIKIILIVVSVLILSLIIFSAYNLNYDYTGKKFMDKKGKSLSFEEKQFKIDENKIINYAEGPNNGPTLVLIHGQMVDWKDYQKVIPELSKNFHIIALDYYGHGSSSKSPESYNIISIGEDISTLIKSISKEKVIITGHSSGALITSYIASKHPEIVEGIILEDGPFFSTEKGRAQNTFSYADFKNINDYLEKKPNISYFEYSLEHNPMKTLFNKDGNDNWSKIVVEPALKIFKKDSKKMPIIWYYPPRIGINKLLAIYANMQDKTGDYDLRFGQTFYNFSFFRDIKQEEMLSKIKVPTYILHVDAPKDTAPSYYTKEGILISAMDNYDAEKVRNLIQNSKLFSGFKSNHDIHDDLPNEFIKVVLDFKEYIKK